MIPITSPPLMIKNYALKFTEFFSRPQFSHFVTYLTGLIVSVNKTVKISKLGKIKLVLYHETEDFSDPLTIIGSNAHVWTPDKIIYCYKQRWSIETFPRFYRTNICTI